MYLICKAYHRTIRLIKRFLSRVVTQNENGYGEN